VMTEQVHIATPCLHDYFFDSVFFCSSFQLHFIQPPIPEDYDRGIATTTQH